MRDPWNPTPEELRQWAAEPHSLCPEEEWDWTLIQGNYDDLLLELAADGQCPKQVFFLHCLYLLTYDAVRTQGRETDLARLDGLLRRGDVSGEEAVRLWAKRSRDLLADPQRLHRDLWWQFGQGGWTGRE